MKFKIETIKHKNQTFNANSTISEFTNSQCTLCPQRNHCPLITNNVEDHKITKRKPKISTISKSKMIFTENAEWDEVHMIIAGGVVTSMSSIDGEEQNTGIHLPGELIGFMNVDNQHINTATTIMKTKVCSIPSKLYNNLANESRTFRHRSMKRASNSIIETKLFTNIIKYSSAAERINSLMNFINNKHQRLNNTATKRLPNKVLSNIVGIAPETFSRKLKLLQKQNRPN
ncbi:Crp/Fnr family transcriptional regulator [Vibrio barjaei]|uniref:Crp/Fnr family transcriptional regulator n=1 Tax=Vibrio barjaei TaxID=1676683 RepID=UPI0022852D05|nr:Crp/Fnr family transcriptional regulator [Vibrio barjaei]MCY9874057.1 Crp/Fnr family transcriptional regulator [Vibrio barjaei]